MLEGSLVVAATRFWTAVTRLREKRSPGTKKAMKLAAAGLPGHHRPEPGRRPPDRERSGRLADRPAEGRRPAGHAAVRVPRQVAEEPAVRQPGAVQDRRVGPVVNGSPMAEGHRGRAPHGRDTVPPPHGLERAGVEPRGLRPGTGLQPEPGPDAEAPLGREVPRPFAPDEVGAHVGLAPPGLREDPGRRERPCAPHSAGDLRQRTRKRLEPERRLSGTTGSRATCTLNGRTNDLNAQAPPPTQALGSACPGSCESGRCRWVRRASPA